MKSISVWGLLGDHDGQRPVGEFGQDTPLLLFRRTSCDFNDHRESGPRFFKVSSEGWLLFFFFSIMYGPVTIQGS